MKHVPCSNTYAILWVKLLDMDDPASPTPWVYLKAGAALDLESEQWFLIWAHSWNFE